MHNALPTTLQHRFNHVQDWMHKASFFMLMLMAFGLPWSTALFRISVYGLIICLLLSGKWKEKWQASAVLPEFWLGLGLYALGLVSVITSEAPTKLALTDVQRLSKLLFIGVLVYLMDTQKKTRQILMALCAGIAILMLPTVLDGTKITSLLISQSSLSWRSGRRLGSKFDLFSQPNFAWFFCFYFMLCQPSRCCTFSSLQSMASCVSGYMRDGHYILYTWSNGIGQLDRLFFYFCTYSNKIMA
jgi:hypothetical protein